MIQTPQCRPGGLSRVRGQGITLIELMISLVIGLIVLGAVIALFVAFNKSSLDLHRAIRLEQEIRTTVDFMARDIRRIGHVQGLYAHIGTPDFCDAGYFDCELTPPASTFNASGSRLEYRYDANGDGLAEAYAFDLDAGQLIYEINGTGWPLNDLVTTRYTSLQFNETTRDVALSDGAQLRIRQITIAVTAEIPGDPSITRRIVETVRIRNDEFVR